MMLCQIKKISAAFVNKGQEISKKNHNFFLISALRKVLNDQKWGKSKKQKQTNPLYNFKLPLIITSLIKCLGIKIRSFLEPWFIEEIEGITISFRDFLTFR